MIVIGSDVHRRHHGLEFADGLLGPSVEGPERADLIDSALRAAGHAIEAPDPVDESLLGRVHTPQYIEFIATAWDRWQQLPDAALAAMPFTWPARNASAVRPDDLIGQLGFHSFAADCSIVEGTWDAVRESAAISTTAADLVGAGERFAYGLCRPPGHHATTDQFGGYCYVNNAAVAAQRLLDGGANRVAVLDVDYHHGNGTQQIFERRDDVLTVSIHADPMFEFPWFAGHANEVGIDAGEGWNVNIPLPAGTDFGAWSSALEPGLALIASSDVEALVVSLGVDTFAGDPLGTFDIGTCDYTTMATRIAELDLPTVIVQEGGYAVGDIGANVAAFLAPLR